MVDQVLDGVHHVCYVAKYNFFLNWMLPFGLGALIAACLVK